MAKNFNAWPDQWPKSLNYPEQPVFSFLDQTAARVPNRVAIIFGGMELTYAELKDLSDRFANALIALGLKEGRKSRHPSPQLSSIRDCLLRRIKGRCDVYTPLSPMLAPREATHQLNDAECQIPWYLA